MILKPNDKVLVAHRRLFEGDQTRYFAGYVDAYEAGIARVTGRTWIHDGLHGSWLRKEDETTKIVAIASGTVIVYQLPEGVDLDNATVTDTPTGVFLEDGDGFRMNLSESHRSGSADAA